MPARYGPLLHFGPLLRFGRPPLLAPQTPTMAMMGGEAREGVQGLGLGACGALRAFGALAVLVRV